MARYIDESKDGSHIMRLWDDGILLGILHPFTPDAETRAHEAKFGAFTGWRQLTGQTYSHKDKSGLTFWSL